MAAQPTVGSNPSSASSSSASILLPNNATRFGPLIGSIDEGTTSARFMLFKAGTNEVVCSFQKEIPLITPQEGWVEQDPMLIIRTVEECIEKAVEELLNLGGHIEVHLILWL